MTVAHATAPFQALIGKWRRNKMVTAVKTAIAVKPNPTAEVTSIGNALDSRGNRALTAPTTQISANVFPPLFFASAPRQRNVEATIEAPKITQMSATIAALP